MWFKKNKNKSFTILVIILVYPILIIQANYRDIIGLQLPENNSKFFIMVCFVSIIHFYNLNNLANNAKI